MHLLCPAKINLHLRVAGRRPDGFHPLLTWMTTVGLFDTLTIDPYPAGQAGSLSLRSDAPGLPTDAKNLIVRAAMHLAAATGRGDLPALSAVLEKSIPTGAGLGGGSSDAARTLLALDRLWQINWPMEKLSPIAATLGSDVPFFLYDGLESALDGASCICTGRGEFVKPIPAPAIARSALLVLPDIQMPTPAVYRRFDELGLGFDREIQAQPDWDTWAAMPAKDLLGSLVNDLETPAFEICPQLGNLRTEIELKLARPVRMSGSGSSLFTLYDEPDQASAEARNISANSQNSKLRVVAVDLAPSLADDLNAR